LAESYMPIMSIRSGFNHVDVMARVLEVWDKKEVVSKEGKKQLSEALIGDSSGRVKLVLWGDKAGNLKQGDAVILRNAYVSKRLGNLELNAGEFTTVQTIDGGAVPRPEEVPDRSPIALRRGGRFGPRERDFRRGRRGEPRHGSNRSRKRCPASTRQEPLAPRT